MKEIAMQSRISPDVLDELSEITMDEKTGFEALGEALEPFYADYTKKRHADEWLIM